MVIGCAFQPIRSGLLYPNASNTLAAILHKILQVRRHHYLEMQHQLQTELAIVTDSAVAQRPRND